MAHVSATHVLLLNPYLIQRRVKSYHTPQEENWDIVEHWWRVQQYLRWVDFETQWNLIHLGHFDLDWEWGLLNKRVASIKL